MGPGASTWTRSGFEQEERDETDRNWTQGSCLLTKKLYNIYLNLDTTWPKEKGSGHAIAKSPVATDRGPTGRHGVRRLVRKSRT